MVQKKTEARENPLKLAFSNIFITKFQNNSFRLFKAKNNNQKINKIKKEDFLDFEGKLVFIAGRKRLIKKKK